MRLLATGVPGGYQKVGRGVVLNVIGLPSASTNTIHVLSPDAERDDAEAYADELAGAGLPFVVRERPGAPSWVGDLAAQRGLGRRADFPIMVMDEPTILTLTAGPRADVDSIVELDGDALDLLPRVAEAFALGNELPRGVYDALVGRRMVEQPGAAVYASLAGGAVTSVGIRLQVPGAVGVFGIATPPEHRRRGLGRAVTARILADGVREGATMAFLGASPMGFGIYQRLGFRVAERWIFHLPG